MKITQWEYRSNYKVGIKPPCVWKKTLHEDPIKIDQVHQRCYGGVVLMKGQRSFGGRFIA